MNQVYGAWGMIVLFFVMLYAVFFYDIERVFDSQGYDSDRPNFEFENVLISHVNNGVVEFQVSANRAEIFSDTHDLKLNQSRGVSFVDASHFVRFNAYRSLFNLQTKRWQLEDSFLAFVQNESIVWLDSKRLDWKLSSSQFSSKGEAHIYAQGVKITAFDLLFKLEDQKLDFGSGSFVEIGGFNEK